MVNEIYVTIYLYKNVQYFNENTYLKVKLKDYLNE